MYTFNVTSLNIPAATQDISFDNMVFSYSLQTFHHGFPSQPTCLEYDAVQQLLAIGTETGAILLYPYNPYKVY